MAYAVKYRLDFSDLEGNARRLEIFQDGYVGSVISAVGTDEPVIITHQQDDDVYQPIIGSNAEINLLATDAVNYDDLLTPDEKEFKVVVYYEDSTYYVPIWSGFVIPDAYKQAIKSTPYEIQITASDGLGSLDGYKHTLAYNSYVDLDAIIEHCIDKIGLGLTYYKVPSLRVSTEATDSALTQTDIHTSNYFEDNFEPMDCKTILESVLKQFNLRVFQRGGIFVPPTTVSLNRWNIINNAVMASGVNHDMPTDVLPMGDSLIKYTKAALVESSATNIADKQINPVLNGAFEAGTSTGWDVFTASINQVKTNKGLYSARYSATQTIGNYDLAIAQYDILEYIAAGSIFDLSFDVTFDNDAFPLTSKEYGLYWRLEAKIGTSGLTYYYYAKEGKWVVDAIYNTFEYTGRGNWKTFNAEITTTNKIYAYNATNDDYEDIDNTTGFGIGTYTVDGSPISLRISFYEPYINSSPTGTHSWTYIDGVIIKLKNWESYFGVSGQPYQYIYRDEINKSSVTGNKTRKQSSENVLQHSIDDVRLAGKLINNNVTYDQPVALYKRNGTDTAKTIDEIVTLQHLNDSRNGLVYYEGTIKKINNKNPILLGDTISVNFTTLSETLTLVIDTLDYNVKSNLYDFTGHLINQATDVTYTYTRNVK